ncbi:MAG: permease [Syntrophomonas sp.]
MNFLKRYWQVWVVLAAFAILGVIEPAIAGKAVNISIFSIKEMLVVIPPIFILLGLLDVWVPRETMIRFMGDNSGIKGILLAFFLGSAAAGPLYGAFPIAAVLMKKGAGFRNVMVFIGAWSTTKIPMLLFEISALGAKFAITRLLVDIIGILIIAQILIKAIQGQELQQIYEKVAMD